MSKRKSSGSKRKANAAKRRNVTRRTSSAVVAPVNGNAVTAKSKSTAKPEKVTDISDISVSDAEDLFNNAADKISQKPSKNTMRVSLKAPGVGEAKPALAKTSKSNGSGKSKSVEKPAAKSEAVKPAAKMEKPSKNTMRVSLKAPGVGESSPALAKQASTTGAGDKPSKNTMRVSLKAPGAGEASPALNKQESTTDQDSKPSKNTMRVSLKAPGVGESTENKEKPKTPRTPVPKKAAGKIANTVSKVEIGSKEPVSMSPPESQPAAKKTASKKGRKKKGRGRQNTSAPATPAATNQGGIPKETMRVNLKAPTGSIGKETMRIDLKAPLPEPVSKDTHSVQASSNPFVQNTREPQSASVVEAAPPAAPAQPTAPTQQTFGQPPAATPKSAKSEVLVILAYALGFLALILAAFFIYSKFLA